MWDFEDVLMVTQGRNRAPVARFVGPEGRVDLIVKSVGGELTQRNLCCEYFGNAIAREMGIATPTPHVLDLDRETVSAMNEDHAIRSAGVIIPIGIAVGSEWFRPATSPGIGSRLTTTQREEAAQIYAFDLMLQQPDRVVSNPNVLEIRGHFVAIDFETSCSFLWDVRGDDPTPWRVSRLGFAKDHFFRGRLTTESIDWRELIRTMLSIDLDRIRDASSALPESWHDDCNRVVKHIARLKSRETDLVWEMLGTLPRALT